MKEKLTLKKDIKVILFLLLLITITIYIFLQNNVTNRNFDNVSTDEPKINYEITDTFESDSDIIEKIFANGMNQEDYKKIFENESINMNNTGEYEKIDYDFENIMHYSDFEKYLNELSKVDIINLYKIGSSVDNRNIYNIEIGKGDKVLLIDSNIHSAEVANTPILIKFLIDLTNKYVSGDKETIDILNRVKIAAIPCVNPDGYEVFNFGIESINNKELWIYKNKNDVDTNNFKYNANGVDLNRNFPTQSGGLYYKDKDLISSVSLSKTTKKYTYFGGETLGSEPETRAVMYQMLTHYKKAYAYINIHNQGRVIYSGKPNLSDEYNDITISLCNRIGDITKYRVHGLEREEVGEGNDGTASDFMAELANGFVFSTKTGRLSTSSYKNNNCTLKYSVPAIVVETTRDYHRDPKYFKEEYYDHGVKEMLFDLLNYGISLQNNN